LRGAGGRLKSAGGLAGQHGNCVLEFSALNADVRFLRLCGGRAGSFACATSEARSGAAFVAIRRELQGIRIGFDRIIQKLASAHRRRATQK